MASQTPNPAAMSRLGGAAPAVRRVVTPAQKGELAVPGVSGATSASRVRTPAQENKEIEDRVSAALVSVPGVARLAPGGPVSAVLSATAGMTPQAAGDRAQGRAAVRGGAMAASVVIDGSRPIPAIERDIRARVAEGWQGPLDLVFSDLELPGGADGANEDAEGTGGTGGTEGTESTEAGSGDGH